MSFYKKTIKKPDNNSSIKEERMNDLLNHPVNKAIFNRLKDL